MLYVAIILVLPVIAIIGAVYLRKRLADSSLPLEVRANLNHKPWGLILGLLLIEHGFLSLVLINGESAAEVSWAFVLGLLAILAAYLIRDRAGARFLKEQTATVREELALGGVTVRDLPPVGNQIWRLLAFGAFLGAIWLPDYRPDLWMTSEILFLYVLVALIFPFFAPKFVFNGQEFDRLAAKLADVCARCAAAAPNPAPEPVVTVQGRFARYLAAALPKRLFVGSLLLRDFNEPLIEFVVAHEYAHIVLGHIPWRQRLAILWRVVTWLACSGVMIARLLQLRSENFLLTLLVVAACWMLAMRLTLLIGAERRRREEFEADAYAVRFTRNKEAAILALTSIRALSPNPALHDRDTWSHPAMSRRLEAIRAIELKEIDPPPVMAPA